MNLGVMDFLDDVFTGAARWQCRWFGHKYISEGQLNPPAVYTSCARHCGYAANPEPATVEWRGSRCFVLHEDFSDPRHSQNRVVKEQ